VIIQHATLKQHLASIEAEGLDPKRATGKQDLVWLHTPGRTMWAVLHTQKRHGVALAEVLVLDLDVPRGWLRRAWRGLWTCDRVIPASAIRRVRTGAELAASPLED
jgi:hypothetical protein